MGPGMPAKPANSPNSQRSKPKTKEATKKQSMLNTHKLAPFKYDMNEILSSSQMDEAKASAFLASLIAKASRQSTREAKDFVRTYLDAGDLSKEEFDKICRLMDKYSKYR
jgi:Spy/CpxP family protein refolding chaperone